MLNTGDEPSGTNPCLHSSSGEPEHTALDLSSVMYESDSAVIWHDFDLP